MSRLFQFLRTIIKPRGYIGKDLQGNRFFETPNPNESHKTKRVVKYIDEDNYIGGRGQISAQWYAWLAHTRRSPPSIEELQADVQRRQILARNVAVIDERDRQEQLLLDQERQRPEVPRFADSDAPAVEEVAKPKSEPNPWERAAREEDKTESWAPRSSVRRGG